jgi:purine-binding chemotaxis protein CheW
MSAGTDESDAPVGGLAEDMIPLLRQRLGLGPNDPPPAAAGTILDFAARVSTQEAPAVAVPLVQLITFHVGAERYALPIAVTYEILRVGPITRVPHAPRPIRGLMNVRGRLLPVVETRALLEMPPSTIDKDSRVVTVEARGRTLGLLVDRVGTVIRVPKDAIVPAPPDVVGPRADVVSAIVTDDAGLAIVFDVERAFGSDWRDR